ncbi:sigma-70 family RNA polymerase sigma factor [candidate division KSB1 bacterium]|nr:sigma-70 family RNA polymerase sigma factor [candidate division KSB1 bacterium]NIR71025.1 sigma-70 family RNA polymerase sigma factor [candidate division KSB1 bacterium]NIS26110.1 sigma-70 family RNA polymerase sigma factor [candidate division KSB1 bacterium]NIT72904.1 sigma-70 family RNA polymerase sigma factor [candidate division KSB1 bacterium]NIU26749.1 sigma-70 family RNA polymerase sigma factor [candidate division KSB1 bacterium]
MATDSQETNAYIVQKRREFEGLAFEHMDSLYSTALRMTKNELDAEDLVQDVYVRAFRFFHKFKRGSNFKAWIFKILTNTFINQYRKKSKQPPRVEFDKISSVYVENVNDDEASTQFPEKFKESNYDALFDDEIVSALGQLSDDFRTVVILADIESFSYKEIAEIVGCPIGTVMSRLSRGRKQLQNYLMEYAVRSGIIDKPD